MEPEEEYVEVAETEVKYRSDQSHLMEVAFLPYRTLRLWSIAEPVAANSIAGISELGCFSIVLQSLAMMPGMKEYFIGSFHLRESARSEETEVEDSFTNRVGELMQLYHSYNDCILEPIKLADMVAANIKANDLDDMKMNFPRFLIFMLNKIALATNR